MKMKMLLGGRGGGGGGALALAVSKSGVLGFSSLASPSLAHPPSPPLPRDTSPGDGVVLKEEVVFDFGARIACHMKPTEARMRMRGSRTSSLGDPFEGIPFRGLAEYLGGAYVEATERAREEEGLRRRRASEEVPVANLGVPTLLPFTAMFARTDAFRDTFVVDDDKSKRRTRLSWYSPADGMVPQNWLKDGLLADLEWYRPFKRGNGWSR
ncbi:hypothetical protein HOP50_08g51030 [Chloropicon primus]|nr:hypothetical protein HOP50_08g51030 [Chloropicon primus]